MPLLWEQSAIDCEMLPVGPDPQDLNSASTAC